MSCLGCHLANSILPTLKVSESKKFVAIMDINPVSDGHILILPFNHVEKFINLSNDDIIELRNLVKDVQSVLEIKLNVQDFSIESNEGSVNDLTRHFHLHIIPRNGGMNSDYNEIYKNIMK